MRIPRARQRREQSAGGESAPRAATNPVGARSRPSPVSASGGGFEQAAPAPAQSTPAAAWAVGRYREAWQEAATDAELAFGRWDAATVLDRKWAGTGYFAAFEREEKAALAYHDAWTRWRSERARDQTGTSPAVS